MTTPYSNDKQFLAKLQGIEQKINQNQLKEAAQQLNLLAKTSSHDPRLFLLGSRLAEASSNPDGMLVAARKAHDLAPLWHVASIHLSAILASRGEAEEALALAAQAVQQADSQAAPGGKGTEILLKAAEVALRLNRTQEALTWLRRAEQISPEDQAIRYKIGLTLNQSGDPVSAIVIFTELLLLKPDHPALLSARMHASLHAQQTAQAILDGEALLVVDPTNEEHQFYLDVARGLTPKTMPAALVTGLFDGYAAGFDRKLVVGLQYKLPRDVAQMINQWHPDRKGDVLDLGCGTGLLGACLGPIEGVLIGVDLSGDMTEQAARHGVYDRFHQVNLLDALRATSENLYDVIAALDVFIYVGCLDAAIPDAYRILLPGGRFVFSCETSADGAPDYALQSTHRYTHQFFYVQGLLHQAGFKEVVKEDRVLRFEAGQAVLGFLITARKPRPKAVRRSAPVKG